MLKLQEGKMMRIAIVGFSHEANSFALDRNDMPDAPMHLGRQVLEKADPSGYIGGFISGAYQIPDVQLLPILAVSFFGHHGGQLSAPAYEHYRDMILKGIEEAKPLDGVYLALHGAMVVDEPYTDAEACLVRSIRDLLGDKIPIVGTYDFHGIYTDWEVMQGLVPIPLNTNPHIDAFDRGMEAVMVLASMINGRIHPVTRRVFVPILGPNVGQSTWAFQSEEQASLPLYQINLLREKLEQTPGVINLSIQGGYGYADTPDTGMCIIATTDGNAELAKQMANQLGRELWELREAIRTVRPIYPIDQGVKMAMEQDGLTCLVDLGDDPGSSCPSDSPAVLESLLRLGAKDCALAIRDPEVVNIAMRSGVGTQLSLDAGGKFDQRFYKPLPITGQVISIDDGSYMITGPTHGGRGMQVNRSEYREMKTEPRVVIRCSNKVDIIFCQGPTGKDRDYFKSAGVQLENKDIIVVKSNQAHRASFDTIVSATFNLATPGLSTVDYSILPYRFLPRPIFPLDLDMKWHVPE
jgi:microcystin degradation protein MlrC